jgi:diacylglycerol kinase family enzyme/membrane-associated phospholipid phosphatase
VEPRTGGRWPMRGRVGTLDRAILARLAETDSAVLDQVMPRLSEAASHSVLWLGIAGALGVTRDKWARRAALRGLASITLASAATNVVAKNLTRRVRPSGEVPAARRVSGVHTTSFPSGHAASAAAFATGVALELPVLAAPAGALAGAVGLSRVVTGMHYPSDVLAGFAVGTAAGLLTLRWWPRRQMEPAEAARPRREAPAAPAGQGLVLVVNNGSGTASADLADQLRSELPDARIVVAQEGRELPELLTEAADTAKILGVAGGDGSVQMAAGLAVDRGLPLLVVPAGTFNHFAADLGVRSVADAVAALRAGDSVLVDVARAGKRSFVNTASTGIYVDLVRARQEYEEDLGKWPAVLVALARVLPQSRPADLVVNGRRRRMWLLFAGNCRYEPHGAAPSYRPDLIDSQLDIRIIDGNKPLARVRLLAAVALGTLGRCRVYQAWTASSLHVATPDGTPVLLSVDGETVQGESSLMLRKRSERLLVYRPGEA